ncbi:MAG: methyl-accepting chemotaxis protein, partial [Rubrivivax sp.]|nr:methyl-accepting chemotaxis protein [Rubrivivax sp.]
MSKTNLKGLAAQIGLAAGLPLFGALVVAAVGLSGLSKVESSLQRVVTESTAKSELVAEMRLGIVQRVDTVRNIALTDEIDAMKPDRERLVTLTKRYEELRTRLDALVSSSQDKALTAAAAAAEAKALPLIKEAQAMAQLMQQEAAARVLSVKLGPVQKEWVKALDGLAASSAKEAELAMAEASATSRSASTAMIVALMLALVVGSTLAFVIVRRSTQRLSRAVLAAEHIAAGDLVTTVSVEGDDEIARVLRAIEQMRLRLRETIVSIRAGIGSVNTASVEIASGNTDLSNRTELQASNLQQTASSMEQMTGSVGNSAESSRQAKQLATAASDVARRGGEAVDHAVRTMQDIQASSTKMADIIGVIDGIAFQTNILALNASVEAARAGDQWRGFAVVASEVRSLAQRSAQAAKEIKTLIDASAQKVSSGSKLVAAAGDTMGE